MKHLILCIVLFTVNFNLGTSQISEDQQWLMRDGNVKDGANLSNNHYFPISGPSAQYIHGVAHPSKNISANDPGATVDVNFKNKFFAIGNSGEYYFYQDENDPIDSSMVGMGYRFPSAGNYKYLYLTNIYEDDDPPPNVRINASSINNVRTIALTPEQGFFGSNQDIIHNKDFTIIIDEIHLIPGQQYSLCYDPISNLHIDTSKFNDIGNHIVANGSVLSASNYRVSKFDGMCLYIQGNGTNQFLNFRASISNLQDFDFDNQVVFNLYEGKVAKPDKNDRPIVSDSVSISERFHDPNYVEVQCVWMKDPSDCYVRYRVFCYNESPSGEVDNVSMSMTLPDCFDDTPDAITKLSVNVGSAQNCNDASLSYNNYKLNIDFTNNLGMFNSTVSDTVSAYIEFCARLKSDVCNKDTLQVIDLQPTNPTTRFENIGQVAFYPIVDFIDPIVSVKWRSCSAIMREAEVPREERCIFVSRPNETRAVGTAGDGNCNCEITCDEGDYVWIIVAIFTVLFLAFFYFRIQ